MEFPKWLKKIDPSNTKLYHLLDGGGEMLTIKNAKELSHNKLGTYIDASKYGYGTVSLSPWLFMAFSQ